MNPSPMTQRVLAGAVVEKHGKILLLRRAANKRILPDHWDLPGGKLEPGEDPVACAVRETKEETGLDVTILRPYNTWSCVIEFDGMHEHVVEIDFIAEAMRTEPVVLRPKEHVEYRWFGKDELPAKLSSELRATILKAFETLPAQQKRHWP
jgi:8-oxo-dGTP diphosphatase